MFWLSMLLVLAIAAVSMLLARLLHARNYWAQRGVPHTEFNWFLGSLTFFFKDNASQLFIDISRKYKTPYVGIWLFWKPALLVQSPDLARRILVKDSDNFRDRYAAGGKNDPIGHFNLFAAKDPLWSSVRRRLTVLFTSAKLRNMHNLVHTKARQLVERIKKEMDCNNTISDTQTLYTDYTTDLIGTTAFGVESNATEEGDGALRRITKDFQKFSAYRALEWGSIFFFPQLVNIFGFHFFPKDTVQYFRKVWREIVAQRGGYENKVTDAKDLVDALLMMKQEGALNNEVISEDLMIAQSAVMLQGGFETSASTLSFLTYEIAHRPDIQEKLYAELSEAKEKAGDKDMDLSVLSELTYMNCVIKETLRKYNSMGWFDRVAIQDYKIDENLTIPAGTPVYVNGVGLHYNPDIWPEPEKFDPDRFLPENEKNIKPFTYIPFGDGPRTCIGKRFAMVSMSYAVAALFLNFKVRPKPGSKPSQKLSWSNKALLLVPGEPVSVQFIPRN